MVKNERLTEAGNAVRLDSWKEVAHYMGKGIRTVQRWEQDFGLPIHRVRNGPSKRILAWTSDLDEWVTQSCECRNHVVERTSIPVSIRKKAEALGTARGTDPRSEFHPGAVLTSWKEIATYMGCGVRTVQRWERDLGFPVRRPKGFRKKAILALPADVEKWLIFNSGSGKICVGSSVPSSPIGVPNSGDRMPSAGALDIRPVSSASLAA